MKNRILFAAAVMTLTAGYAFAQDSEALNAARKVEIAWPQVGFMRSGGENFASSGFEVAVRVTDSVGIVGEVRTGISSELDDALISYRAGARFSKRSGNRMTAFAEGLAGGASGFSVITSRNFTIVRNTGSGFSFAAGGGIDVGLKRWLGVRLVQADYEMTRAGGRTQNGIRVNVGLVFRLGKVTR